jgi:hypothetical protein
VKFIEISVKKYENEKQKKEGKVKRARRNRK